MYLTFSGGLPNSKLKPACPARQRAGPTAIQREDDPVSVHCCLVKLNHSAAKCMYIRPLPPLPGMLARTPTTLSAPGASHTLTVAHGVGAACAAGASKPRRATDAAR